MLFWCSIQLLEGGPKFLQNLGVFEHGLWGNRQKDRQKKGHFWGIFPVLTFSGRPEESALILWITGKIPLFWDVKKGFGGGTRLLWGGLLLFDGGGPKGGSPVLDWRLPSYTMFLSKFSDVGVYEPSIPILISGNRGVFSRIFPLISIGIDVHRGPS